VLYGRLQDSARLGRPLPARQQRDQRAHHAQPEALAVLERGQEGKGLVQLALRQVDLQQVVEDRWRAGPRAQLAQERLGLGQPLLFAQLGHLEQREPFLLIESGLVPVINEN